MARAYSQDLRDRVIEARKGGTSARKAAGRFEVAASTAIKWLERLRDSGERSARRQGRRPGSKLDPHGDVLLAAVEAEPDSTLEELRRRLAEERGVRASISTIWTFLDRHDLTFKKKSTHAAEQNRPDVREERQDWFEGQLDLEPERLVFVDESFATTNWRAGTAALRALLLTPVRCRRTAPGTCSGETPCTPQKVSWSAAQEGALGLAFRALDKLAPRSARVSGPPAARPRADGLRSAQSKGGSTDRACADHAQRPQQRAGTDQRRSAGTV